MSTGSTTSTRRPAGRATRLRLTLGAAARGYDALGSDPRARSGRASMNVQSVPGRFTIWHPAWPQLWPPGRAPARTFRSEPSDSTSRGRARPTTATWTCHSASGTSGTSKALFRGSHASDARSVGLRVWVPSPFQTQQQLHTANSFYQFPPQRPTPFDPNAHWLHITGHHRIPPGQLRRKRVLCRPRSIPGLSASSTYRSPPARR